MNLSRENEETLPIDLEGVMVPLYDFVQAVVVKRPGTGCVVLSIDAGSSQRRQGREPREPYDGLHFRCRLETSRPISTVMMVSDMLRVYEHYAGTEPQSSPNYE